MNVFLLNLGIFDSQISKEAVDAEKKMWASEVQRGPYLIEKVTNVSWDSDTGTPAE